MTTRNTKILGRDAVLSGDANDAAFASLPEQVDDDVVDLLRRIVPRDLVALDIGANLGITTIAMSRLAPDGHVHTFEANPAVAEHLRANVRTNTAGNVTVHAVAVSAESGELTFASDNESSTGSAVVDRAAEISRRQLSGAFEQEGAERRSLTVVPATTVDEFVAEAGLDRLDLLKIDVEGHDIDVLRGAKQTIAAMRPTAIVEFASFAIATHRQLLPAQVLDEIREMFDKMFVVSRLGFVREMTHDRDAWELLWQNANVQPVHDLVCTFGDSRLLDALRAITNEGPPASDAAVSADVALARELRRNEEHTRALEALRKHVGALEENERLMRATLSWRITRPLRSVRKMMRRGRETGETE